MRNSKWKSIPKTKIQSAQKFRDYAAECPRLARTATGTDRAVLIEIADAWIVCAEQPEREAKRRRQDSSVTD